MSPWGYVLSCLILIWTQQSNSYLTTVSTSTRLWFETILLIPIVHFACKVLLRNITFLSLHVCPEQKWLKDLDSSIERVNDYFMFSNEFNIRSPAGMTCSCVGGFLAAILLPVTAVPIARAVSVLSSGSCVSEVVALPCRYMRAPQGSISRVPTSSPAFSATLNTTTWPSTYLVSNSGIHPDSSVTSSFMMVPRKLPLYSSSAFHVLLC